MTPKQRQESARKLVRDHMVERDIKAFSLEREYPDDRIPSYVRVHVLYAVPLAGLALISFVRALWSLL